MKLNLGCGEDYRDEFHNVDIDESVPADEYLDLERTPWPYDDGQFQEIHARHVLEHLETVPWDELYRILESGGTLVITYPLGHTRDEDITHEQRWNWNSASFIAGNTDHEHELSGSWALESRSFEYRINNPEPLVKWYTRYRLWLRGPGVWLETIPGLSGEWTVVLEKQ